MNRWLFVLLAFLLLVRPTHAEPRILVVGDSWAAGIVGFQAFEKVFEERGVEGVEVIGMKTAIGGSRADQWANNHQGKLDTLTSELKAHPTVDLVHLSIGGNDFLNYCLNQDVSQATPEVREREWKGILADIERVLQHIQEVRPNARILLCGYDFLDPEKIAKTYGLKAKGNPSTRDLNQALVEFGKRRLALAQRMEGVEYVQNFGLLQHGVGIEGDEQPGSVSLPGQAPDYKPFPGGDPGKGSGLSMPDGVHPTPEGYVRIVDRCFAAYYDNWLRSR